VVVVVVAGVVILVVVVVVVVVVVLVVVVVGVVVVVLVVVVVGVVIDLVVVSIFIVNASINPRLKPKIKPTTKEIKYSCLYFGNHSVYLEEDGRGTSVLDPSNMMDVLRLIRQGQKTNVRIILYLNYGLFYIINLLMICKSLFCLSNTNNMKQCYVYSNNIPIIKI